MTLDEWAALDEDTPGELVDGFIEEEEMAPYLHELVLIWVAAALRAWALRQKGYVVGSETKLAIGPRRGRKPDLAVFLPPALPALADTLIRVAPAVAVEIVSPRPRDAARDRIEKLADYASVGVRHYWLLDPQLRSLEVFELGRDRRYTVTLSATHGRVRIPGCRGLLLDLDDLWKEVDHAALAHQRSTRRPRGLVK